MRQSALFLSVMALFLFASIAFADDSGEAIFNSMGCGSCHKMEESTPMNPSVAKIAEAYQGDKEQMIAYLNGESEPIVKDNKTNLMKGILRKTQELSEEDRAALAEYMLGQ